MIQEIIPYAPIVLMLIMFAIQYRIFMTPADFQREKANFIQWVSEHYVSDKTYRENHKELQNDIRAMRSELADIKNILIEKG